MAQVLPVFGLAVVIEARTLIQSWQRRQIVNEGVRRFQILLLVAAAIGVAWGMSTALIALERNENPNEIRRLAANISVSAAISGTLINPMTQLLIHAESRAFSRVFGWSPSLSWKLWRLRRQQIGQLRRVQSVRSQASQRVQEASEMLSRVARLHASTESLPAQDETRQMAEQVLGEARLKEEECRRFFREMICHEQNLRLYTAEIRTHLRDWRRHDRDAFASWAQRMSDPIAGPVVTSYSSALSRAAPDDGGFLPTESPVDPMPRYDMDRGDTFLTDPTDLYETRPAPLRGIH